MGEAHADEAIVWHPNGEKEEGMDVLKYDAAKDKLGELRKEGARAVKRAVSHHGSDCPIDCDGSGYCRSLRLYRLRKPSGEEWAALIGDRPEGRQLIVSGPIRQEPYYYGGGFWNKVEV